MKKFLLLLCIIFTLCFFHKVLYSNNCNNFDIDGDCKFGVPEVVFLMNELSGKFENDINKEELADLLNNTLVKISASLNENGVKQVFNILSYMGIDQIKSLNSIQNVIDTLLNTPFNCGTIQKDSIETILFSFNANCNDISGDVSVTPTLSNEQLLLLIDFDDLFTEKSSIDGQILLSIALEEYNIVLTCQTQTLLINNQNLNGTFIIKLTLNGNIVSIKMTGESAFNINTYQGIIKYDLIQNSEKDINGTAEITLNEKKYFIEFENIILDPICQIPTSGNIYVNGILVNFNNTNCSNQIVTVIINSYAFEISIEQAIEYLTGMNKRKKARLKKLDECSTLLNELKQNAISEMQEIIYQNLQIALEQRYWRWPIGWGYENVVYSDVLYQTTSVDSIYDSAPVPEKKEEGAIEYSETNNQVAGVDEADFVKNDAYYIYMLSNNKFQIIKAWPAVDAKKISEFQIQGTPDKMFIYNNRVMIYSSLEPENSVNEYSYYYQRDECTYGYNCEFTGNGKNLKITMLDITEISKPKLIREIYYMGSFLNARRIDDAVHTVVIFPEMQIEGLKYWPDELNYYYWNYEYDLSNEEIEAMFSKLRHENEKLILDSDISQWMPSYRDISYINNEPVEKQGILGNCNEYYVSQQKGNYFIALNSNKITADYDDFNSTVIFGNPGAVYASKDSFFICSRQSIGYMSYWFFEDQNINEASTLHKFALTNNPPASSYIGSGFVKGHILNQFSMDEYNGFFRIATTTGHVPSPDTHSTISIVEQKGKELLVVGKIDNIAPTEDIRSAKFDKDRGYIVTFKKTDPLFIFDLSNPYIPKISGDLKIPGYSTYMHRIDSNHLLTIGYDADDTGNFAWFQGIMLQIFDVSDMTNPKLDHKEIIGTRGSTSDACINHLAFNYFNPKKLLAIPMIVCEGGSGGQYGDEMTFNGLMVYNVTIEKGFDYLGGVSHKDENSSINCSNWWTESNSLVKRSIFMDDYVFSITNDEIKINSLENLGIDIKTIGL